MTGVANVLEDNASVQSSAAAKLNRLVMKKMQKALKSNPETDLTLLFPSNYSERVKAHKAKAAKSAG